jgi:hypothetical protein
MKISERISQIIGQENISVRSFENIIGCSNGTIAKSIKNGTDISSRLVSCIVEKFPQYNTEWLLTGNGDMLRQSTAHEQSAVNEVAIYKELLEQKDNEIKALNREIGALTHELNEYRIEPTMQRYCGEQCA